MAGGLEPQLLGLSDREANAVVRLGTWRAGQLTSSCTGVVIAAGWMLTARHCLDPAADELSYLDVGADADCPLARLPITEIVSHPEADLLLVGFEGSAELDTLVTPLPPALDIGAERLVGESVQLAGYGADDAGTVGRRRFLSEEVSFVSDSWIRVEGAGRSGACVGDSGGPLLYRLDGQPSVLGILTLGSADCRGADRYLPVTAARDWLRAHVVFREERAISECGAISSQGRCFAGEAVYCEEEALRSENCGDALACAWSRTAGGFRCVDAPDPECGLLTQLGECQDATAQRCSFGARSSEDCLAASQTCARSHVDGQVGCTATD